jgi:hypothetical protein
VQLERRGSDGDFARAGQWFGELDGRVDALGVGGADLGLTVGARYYPLHSVTPLVRAARRTPVVDGSGLKQTLERRLPARLTPFLADRPRRVLLVSALDRWGLAQAFVDAGYECVFGDLMFALGLPWPLRTLTAVRRLASLLLPVITRLPFHWIYPVGAQQEQRAPRYENWYRWAGVIAGDCHYIKRHLPQKLTGQIICTNTTTPADGQQFRAAGARALITSTPVVAGRSFGTNLLEAGLVAAAGLGRALTLSELESLHDRFGWEPTWQDFDHDR